jgi:hypothetical protein
MNEHPWQAVQFFQRDQEIRVTQNRLPHWQLEGACYFLTFRLGDSLPKKMLDRWREEKSRWLAFHPEPWDEAVQQEYRERFEDVIDDWLDAGHGRCLLADPTNAAIVRETFLHFEGSRHIQHAFVVMPNHVHLLCSLARGEDLGKLVGAWKGHSAKAIRRRLGERGALWQRDYFDRLIRSERHYFKVVRYLRKNHRSASSALLYEAPWLVAWMDR